MNYKDNNEYSPEDFERLVHAVSSWYVRRDGKYYDVDRHAVKLSKDDVMRASLVRFRREFPQVEYTPELMRDVFRTTIDLKHVEEGASIPIWDGRVICDPAVEGRQLPDRGMVALNSWKSPDYRKFDVEADLGVTGTFLETIFPDRKQRDQVLDWLTWCLRYEDQKPAWSPFLYSETKGSGKSTFCELVAALFGHENTATLNGVEKITGRFNSTVVTSKLVICEEVHLRPDSQQGNTLKTFITEEEILSERKGHEAERLPNCCAFIFTSNHLPLWIEKDDRRYYLLEVDHDGHAAGPRAGEFAAMVQEVRELISNPIALARVYRALMERVHGASELTARAQLREHLDAIGAHALPESDVTRVLREDLGVNMNATKHLMSELGWAKQMAKWGGRDYRRAIWVRTDYWVEDGKLRGPDEFEEGLAAHLEKLDRRAMEELC